MINANAVPQRYRVHVRSGRPDADLRTLADDTTKHGSLPVTPVYTCTKWNRACACVRCFGFGVPNASSPRKARQAPRDARTHGLD